MVRPVPEIIVRAGRWTRVAVTGARSMNEDQVQVRKAILEELTRQAVATFSTLQVEMEDEQLTGNGEIDLDSLAIAIIGSMAGDP